MPRRYKSQWQWHQRCIFAAFTFAFFPLLWRIMPFILKRSSGAFSINSPKMTLHIHDLIALFWTLDLESYYSRWTSTMADSTIDESTFLGFLSLLFFHLFFSSFFDCTNVPDLNNLYTPLRCQIIRFTSHVRNISNSETKRAIKENI